MSDQVKNPEDRFSHNEAHTNVPSCAVDCVSTVQNGCPRSTAFDQAITVNECSDNGCHLNYTAVDQAITVNDTSDIGCRQDYTL